MWQEPACGENILRGKGDILEVTLHLEAPRAGRAVVRTNIGEASVRRREIIAESDLGEVPLARAWRDFPMIERVPGIFTCLLPLQEVGVFSAKACFFPKGSDVPEWPQGENFHVKVESAYARKSNAIYTVFPRQFGSFRAVIRQLETIMGAMGFKIIQTLPPFPVPVSYAVMGEYGCPFAATDFKSVDPAMAEFDEYKTPLDQFQELIDAVHARGGSLFIDLPANHTGWASTLQTHHPEWFHRAGDGRFISPGAWGVTWADLVELDYAHSALRAYMADVFLFWCRLGVDGFRCDAGYMIPAETWNYIVARVREEYPDTIFMLEGLGGKIEVTNRLLSECGLNWAYSEIFQTYTRDDFERYLPSAIARSERFGTLVHFAETHDNDRLAKGGKTYARLRVQLAALLSQQGAWGIANGVEWFATEKIDVHGKNDLKWGAAENMVPIIARLNEILDTHAAFGMGVHLKLITRGGGNTLAIVRHVADRASRDVLILANLDCAAATQISWAAEEFPDGTWQDLLTGRTIHAQAAEGLTLGPGEVLCLEGPQPPALENAFVPELPPLKEVPYVKWRYPGDLRREVVLPLGMALHIISPYPCRVELREGAATVAAARSEGGVAVLPPLPYHGDGTRAFRRRLCLTVFEPTGVKHVETAILYLPALDDVRAKTTASAREVQKDHTLETILSNAVGSCACVKAAWGNVGSKYDALFAANTKLDVPGDRLILWTRCRIWLQHEGYSRELNEHCLTRFRIDPAGRFAVWYFCVPCGMGRTTSLALQLELAPAANAARLSVRRFSSGALEQEGSVRLVFRPDLEWRSFHSVTRAQGAVENAFAAPQALEGTAAGFRFKPYGESALTCRLSNAVYHHEPQWTYSINYPEDGERGLESCGDVWSPGWISADLAKGGAASLEMAFCAENVAWPKVPPAASALRESTREGLMPPQELLREGLRLFIANRNDVKTVIAGFPWFLDWGRDTFIFLRGAIAAGMLDEALKIVLAFARFEENGTLPNIIYGETAGNRDTSDAQLWFIVAVRDLVAKMGRKILKMDCRGRTLLDVLESIVAHYRVGTANGIRVDEKSGLVWSPAHFTWMDTNYPACTPRCGYPVEIEALWIAALRFLGKDDQAEIAAQSLVDLFETEWGLADCLDAEMGEAAAQARRDEATRPNQLFVLSLEALPRAWPPERCLKLAHKMLAACEGLLIPGGIRTLDERDARYRGIYTGNEDASRKPAYHNGTAWAWPFPLYAEALYRTDSAARERALSLLAGALENLNTGCLGHVSEIADGDAPHAQKGCRAQAWSESELLRVALMLAPKP